MTYDASQIGLIADALLDPQRPVIEVAIDRGSMASVAGAKLLVDAIEGAAGPQSKAFVASARLLVNEASRQSAAPEHGG